MLVAPSTPLAQGQGPGPYSGTELERLKGRAGSPQERPGRPGGAAGPRGMCARRFLPPALAEPAGGSGGDAGRAAGAVGGRRGGGNAPAGGALRAALGGAGRRGAPARGG